MARARSKSPQARTRRVIMEILKQEGPREASVLAKRLDVSAMAVRQHLYELQDEKLITYTDEPRPMGRPARIWRLTPQADKLFPDAHAALTVRLIEAMEKTFGPKGMDKLLSVRMKQQLDAYRKRVPAAGPLRNKVEALAALRTEEGYMSEAVMQSDGSCVLVENHCPICAAATACQGFCATELDLFQALLGQGVSIERKEHILNGARRCAYVIKPK